MVPLRRRESDKAVSLAGFRDISKVVLMLLLGIIAYFLKGMDSRFQRIEEKVEELSISFAVTDTRIHHTLDGIKRNEQKIENLEKKHQKE